MRFFRWSWFHDRSPKVVKETPAEVKQRETDRQLSAIYSLICEEAKRHGHYIMSEGLLLIISDRWIDSLGAKRLSDREIIDGLSERDLICKVSGLHNEYSICRFADEET